MAESTRTTKTGKAKSKPKGANPRQRGIQARGKKGLARSSPPRK